MESFDCDLYMDLMPLVKDGAASECSRCALEAHLKYCESCRTMYDSLPEAAPAADRLALKKIRRRLTAVTWMIVLCASLAGAMLSQTSQMGYNLILFPLVGIAAYCAIGKEAWKTVPGVTVLCLLIALTRSGENMLPALGFSLCYGAVFLLGVGLAWVMHAAFADPSEEPRWKHASLIMLALALTVGCLYTINRFTGNPISRTAAEIHARQYIQDRYPDLNLEADEVYYDWYSGGHYEIRLTSPVSPDTRFSLYYDAIGRLRLDSYDAMVSSGNNTLNRLERANEELMRPVRDELENSLGMYVSFGLASDWVSVYDGVIDYPFLPEDRIVVSELEVDGFYDPGVLAEIYGIAEFNGEGDVSETGIRHVLLTLKEALDKAGLRIATVDVLLYNQRGEDIRIAGFPYDAIGAEDLDRLIHESVLAWEEFAVLYDRAIEDRNKTR